MNNIDWALAENLSKLGFSTGSLYKREKIMSFMDSSIDVAVALGKGVYSVGQDVAFGIQRTGEGLGLGDDGRIANIGYENRAMVSLLEDFFRYGSSDRRSPLYINRLQNVLGYRQVHQLQV
ncbi:hypothetical protein DN062_18165 [Nitrincola tibetensis]|uniref:Uncharacterized protein n=1 Tax=Nitrincola tibetensis TaxID=2219697 RepID=A0A364NH44_9GAMM|nr:hypothetical protein [Nitrincola tibetensis]RAU16438.1 hypothetical protein DN062_18165 [Nitrincola tibetensis]